MRCEKGIYMKYKRIGVDLDGVIADFSFRFSQVLRKLYGDHLPIVTDNRSIKHWDWYLWYPITKEEYDRAWNHILKNEVDFWESLPILNKNEWYSIKELMLYDNIDVYFITSRAKTPGKSIITQCINWLEMSGWNNPQVIVSDEKEYIVKYLKIDYFVDDKKENCEDVKKMNSNCVVYVYDALHNRSLEDFNLGIKRIYDLNEFLADILLDIKD